MRRMRAWFGLAASFALVAPIGAGSAAGATGPDFPISAGVSTSAFGPTIGLDFRSGKLHAAWDGHEPRGGRQRRARDGRGHRVGERRCHRRPDGQRQPAGDPAGWRVAGDRSVSSRSPPCCRQHVRRELRWRLPRPELERRRNVVDRDRHRWPGTVRSVLAAARLRRLRKLLPRLPRSGRAIQSPAPALVEHRWRRLVHRSTDPQLAGPGAVRLGRGR